MKEYGDVPFGANSPTALFRRGQWTITYVWMILVFTSLPIHLFLNGVTGYSIRAGPAQGRVISDPSLVTNEEKSVWVPGSIGIVECAETLANAANWVTDFKNLTIVVRAANDVEKYQEFVDSWNKGLNETNGPPTADELNACYMDGQTSQCSVTVRWFPLVVITIAMIIKSAVTFIAIRKSYHFKHRLYNSLGDFISVATRHREELSVPGECLANNGEYRKAQLRALKGGTGGIPRRAVNARRLWIRYLGFLDWTVWLFWVASIITVWILVQKSLDTVRTEFRNDDSTEITSIMTLFTLSGFGKISLAFILSNSGGDDALDGANSVGLPLQLALANSPQFWFSLGYLLWNNQLTRIWGEHEWRSFAGRRKRPRVSYGADNSAVRNTRWLQLPYTMSILLMVVSTTMHWVVSQTLFVVEVENTSGLPLIAGQPSPAQIIFAICYSPTAIFVIAVFASLLILGVTIYYVIPIRSVMPFMAGSARVVFASCTALPRDLPKDGIMWGDVSDEWGRLAGFAENAKGIQLGEIYPERNKRTTSQTFGDRPLTAYSLRPFSSDRPNTSTSTQGSRYSFVAEENFGDLADLAPSRTRPPLTTRLLSRNPSVRSFTSTTTLPPYTERQTPDIARNISTTSRLSGNPLQTRRPREESELGDGYSPVESVSRHRFSLHDGKLDDDDGDFISKRPVVESPAILDDSDHEPEWVGWGVSPAKGNGSDSENETTNQSTWQDRETSPRHDEEWRGWGV